MSELPHDACVPAEENRADTRDKCVLWVYDTFPQKVRCCRTNYLDLVDIFGHACCSFQEIGICGLTHMWFSKAANGDNKQ